MKNWKTAPLEELVCGCGNVTKGDIMDAIVAGAETVEQVAELSGAGKGTDCALKSPSKVCCRKDIQEILKIYVEAVKKLQEPCG